MPEGQLKRIRVDVPPGLAADPQTLPACPKAQFEASPASCAASLVGETELEAVVEVLGVPVVTPPLTGQVYNLQQSPGLPLEFGINVEAAGPITSPVHLFLEGHVSDAYEPVLAARGVPSGDYHEYFEINNVPTETTVLGLASSPLKLLMSKLLFKGRAGHGNFLTLPSICSAATTSYLEVESYAHEVSSTPTVPPVGVERLRKRPLQTDRAGETGIHRPRQSRRRRNRGQRPAARRRRRNQHRGHRGRTRDAARRLDAEPFGRDMASKPARRPRSLSAQPPNLAARQARKLGTVTIETDLPPGASPAACTWQRPKACRSREPPFTVYLDAESIYGVSVKLEGKVDAQPAAPDASK